MSKCYTIDTGAKFPLPFSHAIRAGDMVYISGQVGVDPKTIEVVGNTIEEQTRQAIRNIEIILESLDLTLDHIINVNAYVSHSKDVAAYNKTYAEIFKAPYPTRTTVPAKFDSYLVEIDAIAYAPAKRTQA